MKFDSDKIYVTTDFIGANDITLLVHNDNDCNDVKFFGFTFNRPNTFIYDTFDELAEGQKVYVLDSLDDLADFIKGKRDFPIYMTDLEEEEQKGVKTEYDKVLDILYREFDGNLEKKELDSENRVYCNGRLCQDHDADCRQCLAEYIKEVLD